MRPSSECDPNRRPHDRFLPPLPALIPRLSGIAVLCVAFISLTIAISAGAFNTLDQEVAQAMHIVWQASLHPVFQAIAELGGIELTTILMLALFVYIWQGGLGSGCAGWAGSF